MVPLSPERRGYGAALNERNNPAGLVTWIKEQRALAERGDSRNDI